LEFKQDSGRDLAQNSDDLLHQHTQEAVAYIKKLLYDHSMELWPLLQNNQLKLSKVEGITSIT